CKAATPDARLVQGRGFVRLQGVPALRAPSRLSPAGEPGRREAVRRLGFPTPDGCGTSGPAGSGGIRRARWTRTCPPASKFQTRRTGMASSSKRKTTMAKLNRERKLAERRLEKQAKKDARKRAAAEQADLPAT